MRTIGCRDIHCEIEEADQADLLSLVANDHLKNCPGCEAFYNEQFKLRQIMSSLGTVAAPGDFDFRLRARLAGEKRGASQTFTTGNFSFGFRYAAFAAVLLMIGSALLVVSLRPGRNDATVADNSAQEAKTTATQPLAAVPESMPLENDVSLVVDAGGNRRGQRSGKKGARRPGPASTEGAVAGNDRVATRDIALTQATVLKPEALAASAGHSVFPIEASSQSLKVSVDNGRGRSKTISLPGVSFGSQGVLAQSTAPLLASARGAW